MIHLIIGGSGSGKSVYGEECAMRYPDSDRIYLATMKVYDEEGEKKVARHRQLRKDKGFTTIEKTNDIGSIQIGEGKIILLECMSNLLANEMFTGDGSCGTFTGDGSCGTFCGTVEKIVEAVRFLGENNNLIIISNNVFEDGIEYDEYTNLYLEALGSINTKIAAIADRVDEVVVGIPVNLKK